MLERTRVAMRRLLAMANLYENLCGIYGITELGSYDDQDNGIRRRIWEILVQLYKAYRAIQ
jgi:hypothetical protein